MYNRKLMKQHAHTELQQSWEDFAMLCRWYFLPVLAISAFTYILTQLLNMRVERFTNLSDVGTRTLMETGQVLLNLAVPVALMYLNFGYLWSVMEISRRHKVTRRSLLEGFRWWWPILRTVLLLMVIAVLVMVLCMNIVLTCCGPAMSRRVAELNVQLAEEGIRWENSGEIPEAMVAGYLEIVEPVALAAVAVSLVVIVVISYPLRMTFYFILDFPEQGAVKAINRSRKAMRRNCIPLLLMDLSYWWYYLLEFLAELIGQISTIWVLFDLSLPGTMTMEQMVLWAEILSIFGRCLLWYFARNRVEAGYFQFYEALRLPHTTNAHFRRSKANPGQP